ncbi:nitrogen fixation protein NifX [Rhodovulum euryhalinum]|uniref:Nitrogen fixation protein NifX n=1 Tax=Rhodovulum euryhalinum TaxID=35805 RepID=A0A4R2KG12_9RHOB|nr:nitrogen fixation protein NifX [Rhodovulum euryhalinum]TCO71197.1 nitrogen fixation protein NifX [Rhodovulum euryhalinum]
MTARRLRLIESEGAVTTDTPLKIAIATNDMEHLDAHFGSARKFAVYEVTPGTARLIEVLDFGTVTDQSGRHDPADDRIAPKVEALTGCALLFVLAIGGPSAAKVVRAGIHPITRKDPEPIAGILVQVQGMLAGSPPPFLRKVLGLPRADFADDYAEDQGE